MKFRVSLNESPLQIRALFPHLKWMHKDIDPTTILAFEELVRRKGVGCYSADLMG